MRTLVVVKRVTEQLANCDAFGVLDVANVGVVGYGIEWRIEGLLVGDSGGEKRSANFFSDLVIAVEEYKGCFGRFCLLPSNAFENRM